VVIGIRVSARESVKALYQGQLWLPLPLHFRCHFHCLYRCFRYCYFRCYYFHCYYFHCYYFHCYYFRYCYFHCFRSCCTSATATDAGAKQGPWSAGQSNVVGNGRGSRSLYNTGSRGSALVAVSLKTVVEAGKGGQRWMNSPSSRIESWLGLERDQPWRWQMRCSNYPSSCSQLSIHRVRAFEATTVG